jgi:hypothetical protein
MSHSVEAQIFTAEEIDDPKMHPMDTIYTNHMEMLQSTHAINSGSFSSKKQQLISQEDQDITCMLQDMLMKTIEPVRGNNALGETIMNLESVERVSTEQSDEKKPELKEPYLPEFQNYSDKIALWKSLKNTLSQKHNGKDDQLTSNKQNTSASRNLESNSVFNNPITFNETGLLDFQTPTPAVINDSILNHVLPKFVQ